MKPMGIVGLLLMIAGLAIVAMGGMRFLKDRDRHEIGPISVTTEEHGYITPLAGVAAIAVGAVLLSVGRARRTA